MNGHSRLRLRLSEGAGEGGELLVLFFEKVGRGRGRYIVEGKYTARKASRERAFAVWIIGDRIGVGEADIIMMLL